MPSTQDIQVILLVLFIVAIMLGSVSLVFFVLSRISGWRYLSLAYPGVQPLPGATRTYGSLSMRSIVIGYNNCIRFIADDDYFHIRLIPPFSWLWHRAISIPWAEIEFVGAGRSGFFGRVAMQVAAIKLWAPSRAVQRELLLRKEIAAAESAAAST